MRPPTATAVKAEVRPQDKSYSILTTAITWLLIVMMSTPMDPSYFFTGRVAISDANPVTRVLWLCMFAAALVIILSRVTVALRVLRHTNVFLLLFVGLATLSVAWSIDAQQTSVRLFRLMVMCSVAVAVASAGCDARRFQGLVRPPLTALLVGSILFCLLNPAAGIHHEPSPELLNAWHGLFQTKNDLGPAAAFGFIFWTHAWMSRERGRWRAFAGVLVAAICLVMSRSSTSVIATTLSVMALLLLMRSPGSMRRSVKLLSSALILLILLYSLAMLKVVPGLDIILSPIPMITGKDLTFSNRSEIWAAVLDHARIRPLLGSGYSAYWIVGIPAHNQESYYIISRLHGFYPGSAHNGYLQIMNDLGAVGLICLLGYVAVYFRQSMRVYVLNRAQGALFLSVLLQQATINLSEPLWLNVQVLDFVLMTIATTCIARILLDARAATQRAVTPAATSPDESGLQRPRQSWRPQRPGPNHFRRF